MNQLIGRKKINPNQMMKSFPLLAIEQWERLILAHNVEFRGGFEMEAVNEQGGKVSLYVPDTREVFCNTCLALAMLVEPYMEKKTTEKYKTIKEKLERLKDEFLDKTSLKENVVLSQEAYESEEDKLLREEYSHMRVEIMRELFEAMSWEFNYHNYFSSSSRDG